MLEMALNLALNFALNLALNHHWYLNLTNKMGRKACLAEGNHRLVVAMSEGIPYLPVHVTSQWLEPNESGNFEIIANHLEISNMTEELLPQYFGLEVKSTLCE